MIQITENGKTKWRVYNHAPEDRVLAFAEKELCRYLEKISGAKPARSTNMAEPYLFILGQRGAIPGTPPAKEGFDGYSICAKETQIVLAGDNSRGVLYAVYDLLERWDCRFYLPQLDEKDTEVIVHHPNLSMEEFLITEASPMELRIINASSFLFDFREKDVMAQIDWAAKNRYNGISWQPGHLKGTLERELHTLKSFGGIDAMEDRGLFMHGPGHSFYHFLPPDELFEDHPAYFGMSGGKRSDSILVNFCWSNQEAVTICQDRLIQFVKDWPVIKILYLVANDGGAVCSCPDCQAVGGSNLLIRFFNTLSERMEKECPGVELEGVVGYGPMGDIPEDEKPNGKWGGLHAHWGRNHTQSYADDNYSSKPELLIWTRLFKSLEICAYYTDSCHQPFIGIPYLYALEADMDFMAAHKIRGSFILNHPMGFWWNWVFNNYMCGKIAYYYPNLKPEQELKDFCRRYYGEAAADLMFELEHIMSQNLEKFYGLQGGDIGWVDENWMAYMKKLAIYSARLSDDPVLHHRITKRVMSFETMIRWCKRGQNLRNAEDAVFKYERGEITRGDAAAVLDSVKRFAADFIDYARKTEREYPGTVDAEWFDSWMMNRLLIEPLKPLEARINK